MQIRMSGSTSATKSPSSVSVTLSLSESNDMK